MFTLVLHTHLPWLAHHGSWPVGEEWLYQAWSASYLPLVDLHHEAMNAALAAWAASEGCPGAPASLASASTNMRCEMMLVFIVFRGWSRFGRKRF